MRYDNDGCGCFLAILSFIGIAIGMYISYLIAISDLPEWFKFYLLS